MHDRNIGLVLLHKNLLGLFLLLGDSEEKSQEVVGEIMNRNELLEAYYKLTTKNKPESPKENIMCSGCEDCKNCIDCYFCVECEGCDSCKNCVDCKNCIDCNDCKLCIECFSCYLCLMCEKCQECTCCILCDGLTDKKKGYWLLNKEVTKEEFDEARKVLGK